MIFQCYSNEIPMFSNDFPFQYDGPTKNLHLWQWFRLGRSRGEGTDLGQQPISTAGEADVPGRLC